MSEAQAISVGVDEFAVSITYDILGLSYAKTSEVTTSTEVVTLSDQTPAVTRTVVVNKDGFTVSGSMILIDDTFWSLIGSRMAPASATGVQWGDFVAPFACDWTDDVQFYDSAGNVLDRIPLGSEVTAKVNRFKDNIPFAIQYIDALTGAVLKTDTLYVDANISNSVKNQWTFNAPANYYVATAQINKPTVAGAVVPEAVGTPVWFETKGNFEHNTAIPSCFSNTRSSDWVDGDTIVTANCRDAAIIDMLGAAVYGDSKGHHYTITAQCYFTECAPVTYTCSYTHDIASPVLLLQPAEQEIYISKTNKTVISNSLQDLFRLHSSAVQADLRDIATVPSTATIVDTSPANNITWTETSGRWSCQATFLVQMSNLMAKCTSYLGSPSSSNVLRTDNKSVTFPSTYNSLFNTRLTTTIEGASASVFLKYVVDHPDDAEVIEYKTFFNAGSIEVGGVYATDYTINVKFIVEAEKSAGSSPKYFYPRVDSSSTMICRTVPKSFVTSDDRLATSIKDLLQITKMMPLEGTSFIYTLDVDATRNGDGTLTTNSAVADIMRPTNTWYHSPTLPATANETLEAWITAGRKELEVVVTPYSVKVIKPKTKWKLFTAKGDTLSKSVQSLQPTWYLYYGRNIEYLAFAEYYQPKITFTNTNNVTIPNKQWSVLGVAGSDTYNPASYYSIMSYDDITSGAEPVWSVTCLKALEFSEYNVVRDSSNNPLTVTRSGSSVYQDYSLNLGDKTNYTIATELAKQSLAPLVRDGSLIFISKGQAPTEVTFEDWPGYTELSVDDIIDEGSVCNRGLNVNQGVGVKCAYAKVFDSDSDDTLSSYLSANNWISASEHRRQFLVAMVGAGGGGGGGGWSWFNSNGGGGGGSGGFALWVVRLGQGITNAELGTLHVKCSGGRGGSNGGEWSDGGSGTAAKAEFIITRGGAATTLFTINAAGGGGGKQFAGGAGGGAAVPTLTVGSGMSGLVSTSLLISEAGRSGSNAGTNENSGSYTAMYTSYKSKLEQTKVWLGYELSRLFDGEIPTTGGAKSYATSYADSSCSQEDAIKSIYSSGDYKKYNIYQLLPGGFYSSNLYSNRSDDKYGGHGAASVAGPGTVFQEGQGRQSTYPSPGVGGCGSGHWVGAKPDEQPGRPGGCALLTIFC
jgi:hypothetical protein